MRQIYPDLWQTRLERPIPGMQDVVAHAYLLIRESGNVLFYGTGREGNGGSDDTDDLDRMDDLGGIAHQFLGHWHEASPSLARIHHRFGSQLGVHRDDADRTQAAAGMVPDRLFYRRETVLDDIEVIPTPGHTAGSVSYRYRSPHGRTYLFTGDAIVPWRDSWTAAPLNESDRARMRESLTLLGQLDPDVVIAAAARAADTFREVSRESWRQAIATAEQTVDREIA